MKRRQTKKALTLALRAIPKQEALKQDIPTLVSEIQALAYLINRDTKFCAFLYYMGHADSINVDVAETKDNYNKKLFGHTVHMNKRWDERIPELIKLRSKLQYILEHNELPKEA